VPESGRRARSGPLVILTGVTADEARFEACQELAREFWPDGPVHMPNYLSRWRGVRGVGAWLDRWVRSTWPTPEPLDVLAYILGGAALPYAPAMVSRVRRVVLVRSRFQEAVPRRLRTRLGGIATAVAWGRAVADLGAGSFWPRGFQMACPQLTLVETHPSRLAERLGVAPLDDEALGIADYRDLRIDHDAAYHSRLLMRTATEWLRSPDADAVPS